jgi:integrase
VLDEAQARRIVADERGEPLQVLWVLAVTLGLRRGELLALEWRDVDLNGSTLRVERTLTIDEQGRKQTKDGTKTESSRRTIRLPQVCIAALRKHRARQNERRLWAGDLWQDNGLVFDAGLGQPVPLATMYQDFRRLKQEHELPSEMRPHDLRHTAATLALHAGVPIPAVSNMLGHANAAITLGTYSHVVKEMEDRAADLIDRLFGEQSDNFVTGTN